MQFLMISYLNSTVVFPLSRIRGPGIDITTFANQFCYVVKFLVKSHHIDIQNVSLRWKWKKPSNWLGRSIWNIKIWHRASNFDVGRQFDGFWRPTSIFDVLSQIFDVQHQFLTSYVKSGVNIWCPASIFDAEHQIFDVGRQIFDVGRQILMPDLT